MSLLSAGKRTSHNIQRFLSEMIEPMDEDYSSLILKRPSVKHSKSWSIRSNFVSKWRRQKDENNNKNAKNRKKTNVLNRK
jgi:hypothetical protein